MLYFNHTKQKHTNETKGVLKMDRQAIRGTFEMLAQSQGFYGRLLRSIDSMEEEDREKVWSELESQNFKDAVDLIMYMES